MKNLLLVLMTLLTPMASLARPMGFVCNDGKSRIFYAEFEGEKNQIGVFEATATLNGGKAQGSVSYSVIEGDDNGIKYLYINQLVVADQKGEALFTANVVPINVAVITNHKTGQSVDGECITLKPRPGMSGSN